MSKPDERSAPEEPVSSPAKDSAASDTLPTSRRPVVFKYPMSWREWSEEEKDRFAEEVAQAIMAASEVQLPHRRE
jgi:hypothetical protein